MQFMGKLRLFLLIMSAASICRPAATRETKTLAAGLADKSQRFSTHAVLIFLDDSEEIIDAVSHDLIDALKSQAAPIIVSASLLATIFLKTPTLEELAKITHNPFYTNIDKTYKNFYERFDKRLTVLVNDSKNTQQTVVDILNKEFPATPPLDDTIKIPELGYTQQNAVNNAFDRQNIYDFFKPDEWVIKIIDTKKRLWELIPKKYRNKLNDFNFAAYKSLSAPLPATAPVTAAEYATSFKIDHMATVKDFFKELKEVTDTEINVNRVDDAHYFIPVLWNKKRDAATKGLNCSDIFVSRAEYAQAKISGVPQLTIFAAGHGELFELHIGLIIDDFITTLDFFQKINVSLFAYITCFALGTTADDVYKNNVTSIPKTYSFAIATEGVANATSITMPDFFTIGKLTVKDIDFAKKKLREVTPGLDFSSFIKKSTEPIFQTIDFIDLLSPVMALKKRGPGDMTKPQLRLAGRDFFALADSANKVAVLGNVFAKTCTAVNLQKYFTKKGVVPEFYDLFVHIIPCELICPFTADKLPTFVPMASPKNWDVPAEFLFYIQKISAPAITLFDVMKMFLDGVPTDFEFTLRVGVVEVLDGGVLFPGHPKLRVSDFMVDVTADGSLSIYFTHEGKQYIAPDIQRYNPDDSGDKQDEQLRHIEETIKKNPPYDFSLIDPVKYKKFLEYHEQLKNDFEKNLVLVEEFKKEKAGLKEIEGVLAQKVAAQKTVKSLSNFNKDLKALATRIKS